MWKNKTVLVTGGAGMVGKHLVDRLVNLGADVVVFDDFSRGHNLNEAACYFVGDVGDAEHWRKMFDEYTPGVVFNLAASVGGLYFNLKNQGDQFCSNMRLQSIPVMMCGAFKIPVFVQTSSVCVYAPEYNNPAKEENGQLGGPEKANEGYAWAKRMGERMCAWAMPETRWIVARPTNIYGPFDYDDEKAHVIPALLRKFAEQDEVTVFGGPQVREFIYNDDVAAGLICLAEKGIRGGVYNLGTSGFTKITIGELALKLAALMEFKGELEFVPDMETGDKMRCTDSRKAWALGWTHKVSLDDGLKRTVEWYRARSQPS